MGLGRMTTGTSCSRDLDLVICAKLGPVWHMEAAQKALLQVYNQKKKKKGHQFKKIGHDHPVAGADHIIFPDLPQQLIQHASTPDP